MLDRYWRWKDLRRREKMVRFLCPSCMKVLRHKGNIVRPCRHCGWHHKGGQ